MENSQNENGKSLVLILIISAIVVVGGVIIWKKVFNKSKTESTAGSTAPTESTASGGAGDKTGKKILYWQGAMDPTYISDKPGKSPMGMDLVPVYEGEAQEKGGIKVSSAVLQSMGVKTTKAVRKTLRKEIRTVGIIKPDERLITHVHTKIKGWVDKIYVDFTGKEIKKNEPMLTIYSPDLFSTQEEYILALESKEKFEKSDFPEVVEGGISLLKSARRRLELWDITREEIRKLEKTRKPQKNITLYSPATGIIMKKRVVDGMYVSPAMDLYTIVDLRNVWIDVDIYEYEVPWLRLGQKAEMTLAYIPGKKFYGKVTYIYPYMEAKTRTVRVRLEFKNPRYVLKPDMYANVKIKSAVAKRAVVVPQNSIIRSGEKNIIFISLGEGRFEAREVKLGAEGTDNEMQILKGIKAGEEIVVSAQFLLDSESQLQEAIQKMLEAKKKKKNPGEKKMKMDMPASSEAKSPASQPTEHNDMNMPMEDDMSGMNMPTTKPMDH